MKIMVTGATGFVGRKLVESLATKYEVVAIVRRKEQLIPSVEQRVVPDISSSTDWSGIMRDIDVVIHLAARVHVMQETEDDPLAAFRSVNVRGTRTLAEEAANQGVKKFIFMSSIKVHGEETHDHPYSAADTPSPVDPYGISKWEAEQELRSVSRVTGLPIVILRPPVIYGPGVKGNILRLAKLTSKKIPLPFGAVHNRRSMISVQNLLKWMERAIADFSIPQGPVLVSDPEPISTKILISGIAEGMGVRVRMIPIPVEVLKFFLNTLGKAALADRLLGDLELVPTFEAYPGIQDSLIGSRQELKRVGKYIEG